MSTFNLLYFYYNVLSMRNKYTICLGDLCEYDVDECRQNPCHNGAICMNLYGSFTCNCSSGIGGELCDEVDLVSITSNPANINMDEILGIVGKTMVNPGLLGNSSNMAHSHISANLLKLPFLYLYCHVCIL